MRRSRVECVRSVLKFEVVENTKRVEGQHLRADADDLDVRDLAQLLDDLAQAACAHDERVGAGEQHVRHPRVLADVRDADEDVCADLFVVVHEETFAEAVASVRAADLVAQLRDRILVFVLHTRLDGHRGLVARVELAPVVELFAAWDDELLDRVDEVGPVDQSQAVDAGAGDVALRDLLEKLAVFERDVADLVDRVKVLHAPRARLRVAGDHDRQALM